MATFAFDQTGGFETWYKQLMEIVVSQGEGSGSSYSDVVKAWSKATQTAAESDLFKGPSAQTNYATFKDVNDGFKIYFEGLNSELKRVGEEVKKAIDAYEQETATDAGINLGTLNLEEATIGELPECTPSDERIQVDPNTVRELATSIKALLDMMADVKATLDSQLDQLNNGSGIWDGDYAESYKESVQTTVKTNTDKITEDIDACVNYLEGVAAATEALDSNTISAE